MITNSAQIAEKKHSLNTQIHKFPSCKIFNIEKYFSSFLLKNNYLFKAKLDYFIVFDVAPIVFLSSFNYYCCCCYCYNIHSYFSAIPIYDCHKKGSNIGENIIIILFIDPLYNYANIKDFSVDVVVVLFHLYSEKSLEVPFSIALL